MGFCLERSFVGAMDIGSEYVKNLMWLVRELGLAVNYKVGMLGSA